MDIKYCYSVLDNYFINIKHIDHCWSLDNLNDDNKINILNDMINGRCAIPYSWINYFIELSSKKLITIHTPIMPNSNDIIYLDETKFPNNVFLSISSADSSSSKVTLPTNYFFIMPDKVIIKNEYNSYFQFDIITNKITHVNLPIEEQEKYDAITLLIHKGTK